MQREERQRQRQRQRYRPLSDIMGFITSAAQWHLRLKQSQDVNDYERYAMYKNLPFK